MANTKDAPPKAPLSEVTVRQNWVTDQALNPTDLAPHFTLSDGLTSAELDEVEEVEEGED